MNRSITRLALVAHVLSRQFRPTRLLVLSLSLLLVSGFIVSQIKRHVASSVFANAAAPGLQTLATMSETVTVHAAGRGKPYINFSDGHDILTGYSATSNGDAALQIPASPLAMASADFDEDGVPDLVSGYSVSGGGILILHRGNVDSVYPNAPEAQQRRATGVFTDAPFLSPARVFDLPVAADFVGAGDFDADGHLDVVIATRGENALHFLAGDGKGNFGGVQRIELPGRATAMAAGEVNRADGLIDLVVGVATASGPRALVFESPDGALRGKPESFDLADQATAIAIGNLDAEYTMDIAIAAGRELVVINGRDRKLSLDEKQQATVPKARTGRRVFSFGLKSLAIGDFKGDHNVSLAVLTNQGSVHLLSAVSAKAKKKGIKKWKDEAWASGSGAQATQMVRTQVSSASSDDLVIVDGPGHKLHLGARAAASQQQQAQSSQSVSFDVEDEPMAVMPMRLNPDALSDLVVLRNGQAGPTAMTSQPAMMFVVGNNADNGLGSLRDAITQANASLGLDMIVFNIGFGPQTITPASPLPTITEAVTIDGTTQSGFAGNPIIELNGTAATGNDGLLLNATGCTVQGLVINRFLTAGIGVIANGNIVRGNFIGTNLAGTAGLANHTGIGLNTAANNTIGGTAGGARNVISGNTTDGVILLGNSTGNQIQGNFIGTDVGGTADLGNGDNGVNINGGPNNTVGGAAAGARNVISGNNGGGVVISGSGATGNLVQGNYIGTDVNATADLGNSAFGVGIGIAANNTIGGTAAGARNVISGNNSDGILISGSGAIGNLVQGNFIGTNVNGTADLGNSGIGVFFIGDAPNNIIGGTAAGARNVISGNGQDGVFIGKPVPSESANIVQGNFIGADVTGAAASGGSATIVQGNFIGTDLTGTADLGNDMNGIGIENVPGNIIGGTAAGARNVISGNFGRGIDISGNLATNNTVQGNFIGTDVSGTANLGNSGDGVTFGFGPLNNTIGGTAAGAGNIIAFNGNNGVHVAAGTGNAVLSNSIFSSALLGIELADDGVTPNDGGDGDTGANNLQNFPVITSASSGGANTNIQGTLNSAQNTTFRVEFFSAAACDASGNGEGQTFIGSTNAMTDGSGNVNFNVTFPVSLSGGSVVTATATDPGGNTSEFSQCSIVSSSCAITCPSNQTKTTGPTGTQCGAAVNYPAPTTVGACGIVTCTPASGSFFSVGTTPVTCAVQAGPSCSFNVTVTDDTPPKVTCPANIVKQAARGGSTVVDYVLATATDNCPGTTVICLPPSGTAFPFGVSTVTCTGKDASNNTSACTFTVTITDTPPPLTISCPPNVLAAAGQGQPSAVVNYPAPTVTPTNATVTCAPPSGSSFPLGTTTVNCTARDAANNTSSCSFSVTVSQGNPSVDKTTVDFGNPIAVPNQNPPTDTFTITNASDASVNLTLGSIRRTGSDVGVRITNPDDSGFFTVFVVNPGGADVQFNPGSTITIPAGQQTFRVMFNPSIPAVASGTSNLSASQVLPDVVTSSLNFTSSGGALTVNMTGRVATGLHLIDPANPTHSPVVTFTKSGNQFNLTYSVWDSNLNVTRASHQFLDSGGQPSGQPIDVNLAQALQAVNLLRGQSFTVNQPFTGASSHPEIAGVRLTVFDGETSVSATATLGSSAAVNAPADDGRERMTVVLPTRRIRRLSP